MIINLSQPASALAALLAIPYFGWRSMFLIAWHPGGHHLGLPGPLSARIAALAGGERRVRQAFETVRHFNPVAPDYTAVRRRPRQGLPRARRRGSACGDLFHGPILRVTILGILVSVCLQVPYYSFQAWVPTYLVRSGFPIVRHVGVLRS